MPEFYAGQSDYIPKLNALWDRGTASLYGTSTDSVSLSLGAKTLTTQTGLQFYTGSQITVTYVGDLTKYMSGVVSSYNSGTGILNVNITSVSGSGTFANWTLTLSGAAGAAGIADNISIGTVAQGATPSASITGTSPDKYLNLVLQKGDKGDKGDTGDIGAPNVLTIGTVTQGTASATITGTSPSQVLNLTLPKGDKGDTGDTGVAGLVAKGVWSGATAYAQNDWVTYSGSSYYRKIAGTTGTDPATDTTNWGILAQKGADGTGAVSSVTASAPLSSSGGANPNITVATASTTTTGVLTNADWNTFNGKAGLVSPNFTTPVLGVATATSINKVNFTAPATSATLTILNGKTLTANNTLTFSGTDGSTLNVGAGGTLGTAAYTSSTAYAPTAGSTSVTTLGTVTTGTWNAGIITGQYGGTGVNNSGKTITLGGSITFAGAFTTSFTVTGNTAVTLPTTGTLAILGVNTFTADQNLNNNDLTNIKYATFNSEYNAGNSSTAITIDFANGQKQVVTLTASTTITIANPPATGHFQIRLVQDATGSRAVTWSGLSSSRWLGSSTAPAINLTASGETIVNIFYNGSAMTQSLSKVGAA
jgi:hypothetical protein